MPREAVPRVSSRSIPPASLACGSVAAVAPSDTRDQRLHTPCTTAPTHRPKRRAFGRAKHSHLAELPTPTVRPPDSSLRRLGRCLDTGRVPAVSRLVRPPPLDVLWGSHPVLATVHER